MLLTPQEFKQNLLKALSLGENPSDLSKLIEDSNLQYSLLESEIESTRKYMNDLLSQNDEIRFSNGDLLMKVGFNQPEPEQVEEPSGIDDLLSNIKL